MKNLVDRLRREGQLKQEEYFQLLTDPADELLNYIHKSAREVAITYFGKGIYLRGLIEVTNHCRNNCYYCGIRRDNTEPERYRLSFDEILHCCRLAHEKGIKTFVLQGGEDPYLNANRVEELVKLIRSRFPDHAITLSLGEYPAADYERFFRAGATRYLLRHETANPIHYAYLHPEEMACQSRVDSLRALKRIGYQTGAGMMVGSPGQTPENLVEDLLFLHRLKPEMIGIGPFIPQKETPFGKEQTGNIALTLRIVSIVRLMFPQALIPATTALATLTGGYGEGIQAGANVVMTNLTPNGYREKYAIYDHKKASATTWENEYHEIKLQIKAAGYYLSDGKGDARK